MPGSCPTQQTRTGVGFPANHTDGFRSCISSLWYSQCRSSPKKGYHYTHHLAPLLGCEWDAIAALFYFKKIKCFDIIGRGNGRWAVRQKETGRGPQEGRKALIGVGRRGDGLIVPHAITAQIANPNLGLSRGGRRGNWGLGSYDWLLDPGASKGPITCTH